VHFCIRDDDTSFFTTPDDLERAYGEITKWGPVSLAIVPFHKAGTSKGVPEKYRRQWSTHPLHKNRELVEWLRKGIAANRFEPMLHGYYHDEEDRPLEFIGADDLVRRVRDGRKYLEDLLGASIRVFVPPGNGIGRQGLQALAREGLHLAGVTGVRSGWSPFSRVTWATWWRLRKWRSGGGRGIPWVLDLGDHREISGNAVTPTSYLQDNEARFDCARQLGGVFCAATHYWELDTPCIPPNSGTVGEQLQRLVERAKSDPQVVWRSVGDIVSADA
jgi:peptidoglycan/xylan/chitin deacetylase (PgdA/CDA1 family)